MTNGLAGEVSPDKDCYEEMGHSIGEELCDLNNWLTKVTPNA